MSKREIRRSFIACLTNYGAGLIKDQKVNHSDVLKGAGNSSKKFEKLIISIIESIEHQKKLMK